jgi:hypothetical protein
MVQAPDFGDLHALAQFRWFDRAPVRCIFGEGEVRSGAVLIREVCVQRRQTCSVGGSPTGARARGPVAWMAGRRETKALKPIDETIEGWERVAGP